MLLWYEDIFEDYDGSFLLLPIIIFLSYYFRKAATFAVGFVMIGFAFVDLSTEMLGSTKPKLYDEEKGWHVDYMRLRFKAIKI